jgi:hypothetical protein
MPIPNPVPPLSETRMMEDHPMARHIMVVMTNAVDGQEEAFNDWYDNQHLRDVLAIPGIKGATRYQ